MTVAGGGGSLGRRGKESDTPIPLGLHRRSRCGILIMAIARVGEGSERTLVVVAAVAGLACTVKSLVLLLLLLRAGQAVHYPAQLFGVRWKLLGLGQEEYVY